MSVAAPARITAGQVVPGDRVALPGWPKVDKVQRAAGGRIRLVLDGGRPFPPVTSSVPILVVHAAPVTDEAPAVQAAPEPHPTGEPITVAELKRALTAGTTWSLTNVYITREDHPCHGTRTVTVTKANSSSYYLDNGQWGNEWPKKGQAARTADGAYLVYGTGAGQKPDELTLIFRPQA
jgi:hypothetical protein